MPKNGRLFFFSLFELAPPDFGFFPKFVGEESSPFFSFCLSFFPIPWNSYCFPPPVGRRALQARFFFSSLLSYTLTFSPWTPVSLLRISDPPPRNAASCFYNFTAGVGSSPGRLLLFFERLVLLRPLAFSPPPPPQNPGFESIVFPH